MILRTIYVAQKFSETHGKVDSHTAKTWMHEFKKAGITAKGMCLIANNLHQLKHPEFIPVVFNLIHLHKMLSAGRTHLGEQIDPKQLPGKKELLNFWKENRVVMETGIKKCREILKQP